ncbi:MAG: tetratricopeptide repeat protein, partial [Chloroflexota bacterium]|nr:tetratricopeptide repeat protein [Chloroflexota bacterium]
FWTMDVPAMHLHATEVLALAEALGRGDLEAKALAWLATAEGSAGNLPACVEQNRHAIDRARALGLSPPPVAFFRSMALYWLGRHNEAVPGIREAVGVAREANDVSWTMWSLPNLGLALAGTGRYDEATRAFNEARRMGREYGAETLLARAIACSAGFHLDLFDFAGAEARSQEARELARSLNFTPPAVSAGIDLLFNHARQGEVGQAMALIDEVAAGVEHAAGFHGWLWRLRLAEARAEIALARGGWDEALRWADEAIAQSRARGRAKYEVFGLMTRAQALTALGRAKEASADLRSAVALARPVGDPSLFLRSAAGLLAVDGDDALAAEGRTVFRRIAEAIPDVDLHLRFEAAEPLRIFARQPEPGPRGSAKRSDAEGGLRPR